MSSRQRLPSGRSNTASSSSSVCALRQRPLRLTLIPEENSSDVNSNKISQSTERNMGTGRTLQEGAIGMPSSRVSTQREKGEAFSSRPWAAPSVQNLTQQLGKNRQAHALVVEGRHGDILTAVGSDTDNSIASAVLSRAQQIKQEHDHRLRQGQGQGQGQGQYKVDSARHVLDETRTLHAGHTPRFPSLSARDSGPPRWRATPQKPQFGVVYEHRDCFGKPQFIGHTGGVPEQRFSEDVGLHQGVRNLLVYQHGKSEVVWAGTSAASLGVGAQTGGESTMQTITQSIVEQRAQIHQLEKLKGPKPYSRHGY